MFRFFWPCEALIHALVIAALTNLIHFWDCYTTRLLHPAIFSLLVSWVRSACTCVNDRGFSEFHVFFRLLHKGLMHPVLFLLSLQECEAFIYALMVAAITKFIYFWHSYTTILLHQGILFSSAGRAHTCTSDRGFNELHAFFILLHNEVTAPSNFFRCFHVFEALIHALMIAALSNFMHFWDGGIR